MKSSAYYREWRRKNRALIQEYEKKRRPIELPCFDCGLFHNRETMERVIRRMLPAGTREIREAWPCLFSGENGERRLLRELRRIGAPRRVVLIGRLREGTFYLPERSAG